MKGIRKIAKEILKKSPKFYSTIHTMKFENSHKQDFSKLDNKSQKILLEIKNSGFSIINDFFDKDQCNECIKDMDWMYKNKKELIHGSDNNDLRIFGAEHLSKNIFDFSRDSFLHSLANAYNSVSTVNGFTLAGKISAIGHEFGSGGPWHRDSFFRQFKSLMYLTDVDENHGPFQIISGSHLRKNIDLDSKNAGLDSMQCQFNQDIVEKILKEDSSRLKTLTGSAGTVVLVDTSAIHRGYPLKQGNRYALTNYFFEKTQINQHLVEHFSPLVSPEKVLELIK